MYARPADHGGGLISLVTSDLAPVRQFGVYSAIGCLIALFMVLYGLPTLLQLWPASRPDPRHVGSRNWNRFGNVVTRPAALISFGCLVVFIAGSVGLNAVPDRNQGHPLLPLQCTLGD